MRVAAIYDIHGNLPALEAVLEEIRLAEVDRLVVGGDVFEGPRPREAWSALLDLDVPVQFILGNGDREVLERLRGVETDWFRKSPEPWREPVRWTTEQLSQEDGEVIAQWPATCRLSVPPIGEALFCHATPRSDTEIFTRLTPEERLVPLFEGVDVPLVVCGHTHMQFERTIGKTSIVNAGSVGMPFGEPGAYWLLLGPGIEFRRTNFDLPAAAERIRQTEYPQAHEFAEHHVLHPPSEEKMLQVFSKA